ncbi:hypothetical protein AK812_SmicGene33604 [Symbiodinium microadriaticum]|uniref:Uncharacterized protein n=1 Tax=Symbiodinium microadriaticum TaxID=2951 RepID=A0A1Q9CR83_SYMMI|nr:hypothetical protein AK812_SmicGene33604 [Symbiodinium microadriaticum]
MLGTHAWIPQLPLKRLVPALCHIFTVVLLAGGATRYAVPQTADRNVDLLSQDAIKSAVETISKFLNVISEKVRDVVLWTSSEMTITAVFVLQLVSSGLTASGSIKSTDRGTQDDGTRTNIVLIMCQVAPYVWKAKNAELHQYVGWPYIKQAVAMKDDLLAKVPKYTDVVKEECKESGSAACNFVRLVGGSYERALHHRRLHSKGAELPLQEWNAMSRSVCHAFGGTAGLCVSKPDVST